MHFLLVGIEYLYNVLLTASVAYYSFILWIIVVLSNANENKAYNDICDICLISLRWFNI